MLQTGRVVFGEMDEVVFGRQPPRRWPTKCSASGRRGRFLMVSNSLNRNTDEISRDRRGLAIGALLLRQDAAAYAADGRDPGN